jgi:ABC-type iron transport system FetAB ATPase subunit
VALLVNVGAVSLFAFGVIIRPTPLYNPQYVIPIVGMLLGNCINGVSLSLNNMMNGVQEQGSEIEVYLAFGANSVEASSRIIREAVRVGAMPMLNSMAVIGIISIPGMMTGQILGGSSPMTAAVYQMLIMILIATCTFGTILAEVAFVRSVAFENEMLQTQRFRLRPARQNFLETIAWMATVLRRQKQVMGGDRSSGILSADDTVRSETTRLTPSAGDGNRPEVEVSTVRSGSPISDLEASRNDAKPPLLEVRCISRTVGESSSVSGQGEKRLFHSLSFVVYPGDIVAVRGPSGAGKSQLLRAVAGLSPLSTDEPFGEKCGLFLDGGALVGSGSMHSHGYSPTQWRRQIRYVTQTRIELPGTPRNFLQGVSTYSSWIPNEWARRISKLGSGIRSSLRRMSSGSSGYAALDTTRSVAGIPSFTAHPSPTCDEMTVMCTSLIEGWGLTCSHLDKPWKLLSGGESQRIFVAIAIASGPRVLLLDESTSALDLNAKLRVEQSILEVSASTCMAVVWISHDDDQFRRLRLKPNR